MCQNVKNKKVEVHVEGVATCFQTQLKMCLRSWNWGRTVAKMSNKHQPKVAKILAKDKLEAEVKES